MDRNWEVGQPGPGFNPTHYRSDAPTPEGEYHGLPVDGYKPTQSADNLDVVNAFKQAERAFAEVWKRAKDMPGVDQRALAVAKTNMQDATMWACRAVFGPEDVFAG